MSCPVYCIMNALASIAVVAKTPRPGTYNIYANAKSAKDLTG